MPAATLRILARNFESDAFNRKDGDFASPLKLQFSGFSVEYLSQSSHHRLKDARNFFDGAMYGDCVIERPYETIPPMPDAFSGFGAITKEPEELLLLLRLFQPGDLVFLSVSIEKFMTARGRNELFKQQPYRVISPIGTDSTRQFALHKADISRWEAFAASLRFSASWDSSWFQVVRHFFLYGSSDEFNPNFPSEVDRVADYVAALEATLVPEDEFVSRRLRERAVKLLDLGGDAARETKKLLNKFYDVRSTLAHGGLPTGRMLSFLQDRECWLKFEDLVRQLLVAAVRMVPPDEEQRRSYLISLYDIDDRVRADRVREEFRTIKDQVLRRQLLDDLRSLL